MLKRRNFSQVKIGAIFSYILISANTLYTLLITPMILKALGSADYGVYKSISSLTASMMVLDLGLGSTLMRYIAKFKANCEEEKIESFVSMAMLEASLLSLLSVIVSVIFYFNIGNIYNSSFTSNEVILAKKLFVILSFNIVLHIFENVFNGIITGYNNFIFGNGIKIARLLLRVVLIFVVFLTSKSAITLVLIDIGLTAFLAITEIIYIKSVYRLKIKISFKITDSFIFKESFVYTILIFLTSIVSQVQSNFANIIIGAFKGPDLVTVYSFGLVIYQMFMELSSSLSGVMLPTVTNTLSEEDGINKAGRLVIKVGRIQFALLGAVVIAFSVIGRQFIGLWLGDGFGDVYKIVLILMLPSLFELCINTCLAILRAKNMIGFRTGIICISAVLNLVVSSIGVKYWSYISAALGTGISYFVGSVIVMGIYYKKKFGFNIIHMYASIFNRIWVCAAFSGLVTLVTSKFIVGGWFAFIVNAAIFVLVYGISMLLYGFTMEEKHEIPIINKFC